ncbi:MAG: energy-coupling factor transporter transmembrane protein EcfT [Candidatus Izimaplasma sp.]|nr:energy-coupling factor transporter transmembrane protein EcfT [Candidatus Izimaplasma bacterium]
MNNIIIGQYIPGTSYLYKLDPRSKILSLVLLMVATFVLDTMTGMLIFLGAMVILLLSGKISITRVLNGLKPIFVLLMFTFTFQALFVTTGTLYIDEILHFNYYTITASLLVFLTWFFSKKYIKYSILYFLLMIVSIILVLIYLPQGTDFASTPLQIYQGGVEGALFIMMRLIIIVTLSTILTLTTKPTDLTLGLEKLLKPLKIIKISSEEIALIISIALRYIPTLLDEANKIMLAQASRGVDFKEGKLKDKIVQIVSLLVPMFIISFKRSDELANAMEARNFVPGQRRTRLHVLLWHKLDSYTVLLSSLVFVFVIVITVIR